MNTTIEIKNATYEVKAIDPGFAGVAALEVTKLVNGESYAIVLESSGRATCECPDFVCRHADKGTHCKHIRSTIEAGLLKAPAPVVTPAPKITTPPVTPADLKRARYFGLTIPKAAIVAPVIEPGLVPTWEPELAGDDESMGLIPADVDHWDVLARQLAA
jgi:hypothetical protein